MTVSMRVLALAAALSLAIHAGAAAQGGGAAGYPAVTIPGSQLRSLHSSATGRDYDLYIHLPDSFARDANARYPVLYLLDGQWDFKLLDSVLGGLLYDKFVPEMIIVGITYSGASPNYDALRAADYSPVATPSLPGSGGAAAFLAFLQQQVVPLIETSYRGDPARRLLMGSSFGGLFTLYAMLRQPTYFAGYVAASPAVSYADREAFRQEAEYAAAHRELPARLYLSVGAIEGLAGPVQDYMRLLAGRGYAGLHMQTRVIEGERHSGNKPEAFNRGLRYLFEQP